MSVNSRRMRTLIARLNDSETIDWTVLGLLMEPLTDAIRNPGTLCGCATCTEWLTGFRRSVEAYLAVPVDQWDHIPPSTMKRPPQHLITYLETAHGS